MAPPLEGRRRALERRFALEDDGLERLVVPGTDPSRNPPELPLPAVGLPARIGGRVVLLRFLDGAGATLGPAQVALEGATTRWVVRVPAVSGLPAIDAALQPDELAYFAALATVVAAAPGDPARWLVVHTEAALPSTVTVRIRQGAADETVPAGYEPRLATLTVTQDPPFTSEVRASWLNGINFVLVADEQPMLSERLRQRVVFVCFANAFAVTDLTAANVSIRGGIRVPEVRVRWAWPLAGIGGVVDLELTAPERGALQAFANARVAAGDASRWLVVCTQEPGDFSPYTLRVSGHPAFDPLLSTATVYFKIDCPSPLDCRPVTACPIEPVTPPDLDYLTRDFLGFRRLLLDRLATLGAADAEQNPVGVWSVLVEAIAARADQLAYFQDAVATEAYLHTARLRPSVRRHARLLDYRMHEGTNARAFVQLVAADLVDRADPVAVGDLFLTRLLGASPLLPPSTLDAPLPPEAQVFRALLPLRRLATAHNAIAIHAWGEEDLCLPRGAMRCTLQDPGRALQLRAGDVLLLEATASAGTGLAEDADPSLRHVVRLAREPQEAVDGLLGDDVLEVEWLEEDALPFDLPVLQRGRVLGVARGNLVLADHGSPVENEPLELLAWGSRGRLHARLDRTGLTWTGPAPAWDAAWAASGVVRQSPQAALPDIRLRSAADDQEWRPQRDLLDSDRSAPEFWVEMQSDGRSWVRFGDDTTGRAPARDTRFTATYRIGNGAIGNVGADAIAHLLSTRLPVTALRGVRNPLPATGGVDPEPLEQVRNAAPYAFRRQERAVTLDDWAEVAGRHPEVQRAVATLRWTGSWHTARVHVDRVEGRPVDPGFVTEMTAYLDLFRLAGYDLEVIGPEFVPLDIVLTVCVAPDAWAEAVAGALGQAFGTEVLPDGSRGFFHPDEYTFGDSVYLSQIVARAMAIPGVTWVDTRAQNPSHRFRRWASTTPDALESGVLRMGTLEIARCDSNQSAPERGRIEFLVEGGA